MDTKEQPIYKRNTEINIYMKIFEITEGTRCWKGYERKGFKIHPFSKKRVPNCVKRKAKRK